MGWTRNVASLDMMLSGYAYALSRLEEALTARNERVAFHALFEALNWAAAIDERIAAHWAPEGAPLRWSWRSRVPHAELMAGVRFARNRVHHQWADAIWRDDAGYSDPYRDPVTDFTWRWRACADLPTGSNDHGREVYDQHLAGEPVARTLFGLGVAFEDVGLLLEPPRPAPPTDRTDARA